MVDHSHPELESNIEEVAAAVLGPRKSEFAGGGRYEDDGLVHKVETIVDTQQTILNQLQNGGIKIKFPWQVWAAIITALSGLAVQLIQP